MSALYPLILGVYSLGKASELGTGTTAGSYKQVTYWYARRLGDDEYEVQPLNASHVPSGIKSVKEKGEFIKEYLPEPDYYKRHTLPALKSLNEKIALGERLFEEGKLDDAERSFLKALMIDESNVPANMGAGAVYSEKKEFGKLNKVLKILMNSDEAFQEEQRKQFNTLGMSLRKQGMFEEALGYYLKALEFNKTDENMHFNVARVYYEKGDNKSTLKHLKACLKLNPELEVAHKFVKYLKKKAKAS